MSIGSIVLMPWPHSGFFAVMVTMPSAVMRTNALSIGSARRDPPSAVMPGSSAESGSK